MSTPVSLVKPEEAAPASAASCEWPAAAVGPAPTLLGDQWSDVVGKLVASDAVGALVRELALQSELRSQDGGTWLLRVERQSLNQPAACDKLLLALQTLLNAEPALRLAVEVGPITDSPARRNTAAQLERQRLAEEIIHADPFVQDMMHNWGAKVVPGSIKPLPDPKAPPTAAGNIKPI